MGEGRRDRAAAGWIGGAVALVCLGVVGACTGGPSAADAPATAPVATARPEPPVASAPVLSFAEWQQGFRGRALAAGIPAGVFDAAFAGVRPNPTVLERDRFQPEFSRPIWEYLDSAVSDARVSTGRSKARANAALMREIEAQYAVDAEAVLAIWGLESAYGAVMGDNNVIEALATLAHDGRRQAFAEEQLMSALRILAAGDVTPPRMRGSWAGAMGHTQFIPTSFETYAVDFTGDGRRDIWGGDPSDALASTANYLKGFGWQEGQPPVVRVRLPQGFDYALADQSMRRPAADWQALGVSGIDGPIPDAAETAILLPAGAEGPAWLAYPNFAVIRRYNNATSYALAVATLAGQIAGDPVPRPGALDWPRGDRALSRTENQTLQARLTALGYDTQGTDGIVGPNTRAAVRAFQRDRGLVPDGYVSDRVFDAVMAANG